MPVYRFAALLLASWVQLACTPDVSKDPYRLEADELISALKQQHYLVLGRALDASGQPLANVRVHWRNQSVTSDAQGRFEVRTGDRRNGLLMLEMPGYYRRHQTVLAPPANSSLQLNLGDVVLTPRNTSNTRMVFGGDFALGRRFLNTSEEVPRDALPAPDPEALIDLFDPLPGSRSVVQYIAPLFEDADFSSVNLETPVTDNPSTPHPSKEYVFFTLPQSVLPLKEIGVDYVGLGNNHVFDYLEAGIADTENALNALAMPYSGAGNTVDKAWEPWRGQVNDLQLSMLAACSISGDQHAINYVAQENPAKGGAADLRDSTRMQAYIEGEKSAGRFVIMQMHTGDEYVISPTAVSYRRFQAGAAAGANLVIAHHPHVFQGFSLEPGPDGDVLVAHSLGNLAFDQQRLDTMVSGILRLDLATQELTNAVVLPIYIEDYRPRLIAGRLADWLIRRSAENSIDLRVFSHQGRGILDLEQQAIRHERQLEVPCDARTQARCIVDLRQWLTDGESLEAVADVDNLELGRDLMLHGDIEDYDSDDDFAEAERWNLNPRRFVCPQGARRGLFGICVTARHARTTNVLRFNNTMRVLGDAEDEPEKELSLFFSSRAEAAGTLLACLTYTSSIEGNVITQECPLRLDGGDQAWQSVAVNLSMPQDFAGVPEDQVPLVQARGLKLRLEHEAPQQGYGLWALDDLALISWRPYTASQLDGPNSVEFLRLPMRADQNTVRITVVRYGPR